MAYGEKPSDGKGAALPETDAPGLNPDRGTDMSAGPSARE